MSRRIYNANKEWRYLADRWTTLDEEGTRYLAGSGRRRRTTVQLMGDLNEAINVYQLALREKRAFIEGLHYAEEAIGVRKQFRRRAENLGTRMEGKLATAKLMLRKARELRGREMAATATRRAARARATAAVPRDRLLYASRKMSENMEYIHKHGGGFRKLVEKRRIEETMPTMISPARTAALVRIEALDAELARAAFTPRFLGTGYNSVIADVMEQCVIDFNNNSRLKTDFERQLVKIATDHDPVIVMTEVMNLYETHLISPAGILGKTLRVGQPVLVKLAKVGDDQPAKIRAGLRRTGERVENTATTRGKDVSQVTDVGCVEVRAGHPFGEVSLTLCADAAVKSKAAKKRRLDEQSHALQHRLTEQEARLNVLRPAFLSHQGAYKMALRCHACINMGANGVFRVKASSSRAEAARLSEKAGRDAEAREIAAGATVENAADAGIVAENAALLQAFTRREEKPQSGSTGARERDDWGWRHVDGGTGLESWVCARCRARGRVGGHTGLRAGGARTAIELRDYNQCMGCWTAGDTSTLLSDYNPQFAAFGRLPAYQYDRLTRPLQSKICYTMLKKMVQSSQITTAMAEHFETTWTGGGTCFAYPSNKVGTLLEAEAAVEEEYIRQNAGTPITATPHAAALRNLFARLEEGLLDVRVARPTAPAPWRWELTWDLLQVKFCTGGALQFCGVSLKAHEKDAFSYVQRNTGGGENSFIESARPFVKFKAHKNKSHDVLWGELKRKAAAKSGGADAKKRIGDGLQKYFNTEFERDRTGEFTAKLLRDIFGIPKELDGLAQCVVMGAAGLSVHSINLENLRLSCFQTGQDAPQNEICAIATKLQGEGNAWGLYFLCRIGNDVGRVLNADGKDGLAKMKDYCNDYIKKRIETPRLSDTKRDRLQDISGIIQRANLVLNFKMILRKKGKALGITIEVERVSHYILDRVFSCGTTTPAPHPRFHLRGGGRGNSNDSPQSGGGPRENQLALNIEEIIDMEGMMQKKSADLYHLVKQRYPKFVNFLENYMRKNKRYKVFSIRIKSLKNRPAWRGGKKRTRRKKRRKRRKTRRKKRNKRKTTRKRRRKRRRKTR